jgi:putative endopeptidase
MPSRTDQADCRCRVLGCAWTRVLDLERLDASSCARLAAIALAAACASSRATAPPTPPPPTQAGAALHAPPSEPTWAFDRSTFDSTAAPCDDFYQYVCGGWERTAVLTDRTEASWEREALVARAQRTLDQLLAGTDPPADPEVARLRTFYAACMADDVARDRAGEPTLRRYLARIASITTPAQLHMVLRELQAAGINAWLSYVADRDVQEPDRYRGALMPGNLGLRLREYADTSPRGVARRDAYRAMIARMFELVGIEPRRARSEAAAVLDIESALAAAAAPPSSDDIDPRRTEHPTALGALHGLAPHIDWDGYLALVGHPADRRLNVSWPAYLHALDHQLAHRPLDQLRAALRWSMLDSLADDLPAQLGQERFRFHAIPGAQRPARSQRCQLSTLKALGVELSRQFSLRALGSEARAAATRVVAGLRAPMAERVAAASWLSPEARAATAERVRKLDLKVGYPDVWPAAGDFALRPDAHLDNVLAARSFEQTRIWRRALSVFRRSEWEMEVRPNAAWGMAAARLTIPNGFPDVDSNSMILTAAELEPPVFDAVAPLEVQYGTLGALTGHELVHLLEAYEYDAEGRVHDVWSKSDIAAHAARRQCLIDQADHFAIGTSHVNGAATVDENAADVSGLAFAYTALAGALGDRLTRPSGDGMTPAQRFFIAYAQGWCTAQTPASLEETLRSDGHAPPRFRVDGPLADMAEFAAAFSCPTGARMVRPVAERCQVW